MIEINLLPQELKEKEKTAKFEVRNLLYLLPVIFAFLIIIHLYLLTASLVFSNNYRTLQNKLKTLEPERKELEKIALTPDDLAVRQLVKEKTNWADKLSILSAKLPQGIWFNELTMLDKEFTLKCSVISLEKQEMSLINKFINGLKEENSFIQSFKKLELGPAQRDIIGSYEILKFTLNGKIE